MPLVFFSGGIDSTTLAWDVARFPERYGVRASKNADLVLFSYTHDVEETKRNLLPLVDRLQSESQLYVIHRVEECPLYPFDNDKPPKDMPEHPLLSDRPQDINSMPYTNGLHMWLASWAANLLYNCPESKQPNEEQAFFGFQYDTEEWAVYDSGKMRHNDTSPEFVAALNDAALYGFMRVTFRAPWMENRMNREMIVRHAKRIGVPLDMTSSCIRGWKADCGRCCQCKRRNRILRKVGRRVVVRS